ncbi:MAG: hypothetical protein GY756_26910 [bacterium]|nr:hypothetical protein [bacterium]
MSLFDEKIELISNSNDALNEGIEKIDKILINELIKIYAGFTTAELLEFDALKAADLENKLIAAIKGSNYSGVVNSYLKDFGAIDDMNTLIHKAENSININKIINENEKIKNFRLLVEDQLKGTNKLAQRSKQLDALINPIATQIRKDLIQGTTFKRATEAIEKAVLDKDLGLSQWSKQIATDALNQYDRLQNDEVRKEYKMPYGQWTGSIKNTSRPLCHHMVFANQIFLWKDIQKIINPYVKNGVPSKSYTTETGIKQRKGGGIISGTDASNIAIRAGGYNCGHIITSRLKPPPGYKFK